MKLTDILFHDVKDIWEAYLQHPFIRGIEDGTLPKEKFEYYLIQDYLYLKEYTKVFAAGLIKAPTVKEMQFFHEAAGGTLENETAVHIDYLKKFGHDIEDVEKMEVSLVTESYTSYMQGICFKEDLPSLVAAVLPCVWSYYYIGEVLLKRSTNETENFYQQWIEAYGGEDFRQTAEQWIQYTNEIGKNVTNSELQRLRDIFKKSSLYEMEFWDMAYEGNVVTVC